MQELSFITKGLFACAKVGMLKFSSRCANGAKHKLMRADNIKKLIPPFQIISHFKNFGKLNHLKV